MKSRKTLVRPTLFFILQTLSTKTRGFSSSSYPSHHSRTLSSPPLRLARNRSESQQERVTDYTRIPAVESIKLYFSSPSIQKHVLKSSNRRHVSYANAADFCQISVPSVPVQWRAQANLVVAPASTWSRAMGCTLGQYQRRHRNAPSTLDGETHHPSITRAIDVITAATRTVRTPGYSEETGEGLLRYVSCQVESASGKLCLSLVMNAEKLKQCQPQLSYLVKELKRNGNAKLWHSIWVHCNDLEGGAAMFAQDTSRWHPVEGPPYVREQIPGSDPEKREGLLYFGPSCLRYRANLEGFGAIAKEVREAIPSGSKVCQLYAGVGFLGLSTLLHHGKQPDGGLAWLRCSDESPEYARCFDRAVSSMDMLITGRTPRKFQKNRRTGRNNFRRGRNKGRSSGGEISMKDLMESMMSGDDRGNANRGQEDSSERVTYMQANAATAVFDGQALGADVLIVEPPRRGLDRAVLQQLCLSPSLKQPYAENANALSHLPGHTTNWTNDVRTLIYVTMFGDALAKDLDSLFTSPSGWKAASATGHVLFPGTNHVEAVVVLRR